MASETFVNWTLAGGRIHRLTVDGHRDLLCQGDEYAVVCWHGFRTRCSQVHRSTRDVPVPSFPALLLRGEPNRHTFRRTRERAKQRTGKARGRQYNDGIHRNTTTLAFQAQVECLKRGRTGDHTRKHATAGAHTCAHCGPPAVQQGCFEMSGEIKSNYNPKPGFLIMPIRNCGTNSATITSAAPSSRTTYLHSPPQNSWNLCRVSSNGHLLLNNSCFIRIWRFSPLRRCHRLCAFRGTRCRRI